MLKPMKCNHEAMKKSHQPCSGVGLDQLSRGPCQP